ncbi:MAG: ParA family partition ATPase [Endomicrobiaceae bacterium]|jgi:chromosome partitioning protein
MIISILNQKGGTGKTTIAVNLATYFANNKHSVILIDSDKQGSSAQFRENRADQKTLIQFPAVQITTPTLANDLPKMNYDFIIVDVGGHDNKVFRSAIIASDIVLVPITPSGVDFWSSEETFKIIEEAKIYKSNLKVYGMINMLLPNTKVSHEIDELIAGIETDYEMKFFKNRIVARVQYKYSLNDGIGIIEQDSDSKAKAEFLEFMKEFKNVY